MTVGGLVYGSQRTTAEQKALYDKIQVIKAQIIMDQVGTRFEPIPPMMIKLANIKWDAAYGIYILSASGQKIKPDIDEDMVNRVYNEIQTKNRAEQYRVAQKVPTKNPVAQEVPTKNPVAQEAPTKNPVAQKVPTKNPVAPTNLVLLECTLVLTGIVVVVNVIGALLALGQPQTCPRV
jgi:hypothetical protein